MSTVVEKLLEVKYNDIDAWERYKVVEKIGAKKRKTTLTWIGGDGAVPYSLEGRFDGEIVDDGNGYKIRLDLGDEFKLDYSQAHTLLMLLQLVDNERKETKSFVLEQEEQS